MTAEDRLDELWRKIEAFTARVNERYPQELACRAGCDDCCKRDLTVTAIEAERIARLVAGLPAEERAALGERAADGPSCVALESDGRCAVYAARPVVCRSHGLPLRYVEPPPAGRRALPLLDVCGKNFIGFELERIDPACVLDQQTLSLLLGGIDALRANELGEPPGQRFALRDVIRSAASSS